MIILKELKKLAYSLRHWASRQPAGVATSGILKSASSRTSTATAIDGMLDAGRKRGCKKRVTLLREGQANG